MLDNDSDLETQVIIKSIENLLNPEGVSSPVIEREVTLREIGETIDLETLSDSTEIEAIFENIRFDSTTNKFLAELRLFNAGEAKGKNIVAVFDDLPEGVELATNSSGNSSGSYVNFRNAIPSGGLGQNSFTDSILIEFDNPNLARLDLQPTFKVGAPNSAPVIESVDPITPVSYTHLTLPTKA